MNIESLPDFQDLNKALARLKEAHAELAVRCVEIQQIPAPTGDEQKRARWVLARFQEIGLQDVHTDALYNVYGCVPSGQQRPALLVSAHTDTVFPIETDLAVERRNDTVLAGPGIGDNSAGVAGLLTFAEILLDLPRPPVDIWLVANSNEEGLGDLRGMRAAVDFVQQKTGDNIGATIVLEGMGLGRIVHQALGVRRFRVHASAPGGHSWGDFGTASAIHALVAVANDICRMKVPKEPRTAFNIGKFNGGTSVNTIAQHAAFELDLRSTAPDLLSQIAAHVQQLIERHQKAHERRQSGVHLTKEPIGNRPAGEIPADHPMVRTLSAILQDLGIPERHDVRISSTDANIPLSRNIPAVCIGLTEGGDAHRLSEWIDTEPMVKGMQQLLLFAWWTATWLATR